ncbi:MAG: GFA family protein [Gammaproteobacteria bacterium]
MIYQGGCHCGRIAFDVEGDIESVIECNCSICTKRGSLLWAVSRDKLQLTTDESDLATYTFHTGKIKHRFCPNCGCAPFAEGTDKSGERAAMVNVRCLEGVDVSALPVVAFDGRSY